MCRQAYIYRVPYPQHVLREKYVLHLYISVYIKYRGCDMQIGSDMYFFGELLRH